MNISSSDIILSDFDLKCRFQNISKLLKLFLIFLFLSSQPSNSYARKVDIYGYLEPQLMAIVLKGNLYQLNSNKLRVDLQSFLADRVSFGANFDLINYSGKTEWNHLDYLPDSITRTVLEEKSSYDFSYNDSIFLDNAYLKLSFKYLDLTIGKQQISLGTGYTWNPTDLFNTKDMFDPTYEQPGHNAIRLDITLGNKYGLVVIYAPEDNWKKSGKLLRFKGKVSHFDYSLITIEKEWTFTDFFDFSALTQKRKLLGGDFSGEVLGLGVWGEMAYNHMEKTKNFWELVLGTDYTLRSATYLMFEYYRNTLGKTNYRKYDLNDWMQYVAAEKKALSQNQIYIFVNHPLTDLINLGCSIISSIDDGSLVVVPTLNYNIFEDVELFGYLNFYLGKEGKNFYTDLGNGGLARIRVYF